MARTFKRRLPVLHWPDGLPPNSSVLTARHVAGGASGTSGLATQRPRAYRPMSSALAMTCPCMAFSNAALSGCAKSGKTTSRA